jgi:HK97 family phage portal protein
LLGFLRKLLEQKTLDLSSAWALVDLGQTAASGIHVSPEISLRCPAVRGAVAVLAESVAQLPLILYRRNADGGKDRAEDHPLYELLHDQPCDWCSSFEWRRDMQTALLLHGNAYAHLGRSRASGQIVELIQIPSTAVAVEADDQTMEPRYFVTDAQGTRRAVDRTDLLHIRALGSNQHVGHSPIAACREAIGLALAMEQH